MVTEKRADPLLGVVKIPTTEIARITQQQQSSGVLVHYTFTSKKSLS
jgi:hypothetical protein